MLDRYLTDLWADVDKKYSDNSNKNNETYDRNKIHCCIEQILFQKKEKLISQNVTFHRWMDLLEQFSRACLHSSVIYLQRPPYH